MERLRIAFTDEVQPHALFALADQIVAEGARSLMVLAADANGCRPEAFDDWLRAVPVPVFGGVFPQLIHAQSNHERGYLVVGLPETVEVFNLGGLSDPAVDYSRSVSDLVGAGRRIVSMLVLVDGLASRISALLDGIYDTFGSAPFYFGGGAGSLSFVRRPCLFSNRGMLTDHAQIVVSSVGAALSVEHGWEKLAGPFVVTSVYRNVIESLDFQPAFEVYREHVQAESGGRFGEDNFFDIAKGFPFGMEKPDGSLVVRDPIAREGNNLVCVGEVPSHSVVYLLRGDKERLIDAAARSAARIPPGKAPAMLIDCISRVLFLESEFARELEAVQKGLGERPLFGMLTLGEIANGGTSCLEFYNKTLVLAAIHL